MNEEEDLEPVMAGHLQGSGRWGLGDETAATYKGLQGTAWFQLQKEGIGLFGEELEHVGMWPVVYSLRRSEWQGMEVGRGGI